MAARLRSLAHAWQPGGQRRIGGTAVLALTRDCDFFIDELSVNDAAYLLRQPAFG